MLLSEDFIIVGNQVKNGLQLIVKNQTTLILSDICGHRLETFNLFNGTHFIAAGQLANGIYILQSTKAGKAQRFYVSR